MTNKSKAYKLSKEHAKDTGRNWVLSFQINNVICFLTEYIIDIKNVINIPLSLAHGPFSTLEYMAAIYTLEEAKEINKKFPELDYSEINLQDNEPLNKNPIIEPFKIPERPLNFKLRLKGIEVNEMRIDEIEINMEYKPLTNENQLSFMQIISEALLTMREYQTRN